MLLASILCFYLSPLCDARCKFIARPWRGGDEVLILPRSHQGTAGTGPDEPAWIYLNRRRTDIRLTTNHFLEMMGHDGTGRAAGNVHLKFSFGFSGENDDGFVTSAEGLHFIKPSEPFDEAFVTGISAGGDVVGLSDYSRYIHEEVGRPISHAFLITQKGRVDLGPCEKVCENDLGDVAGSYFVDEKGTPLSLIPEGKRITRAFLIHRGVRQDLGLGVPTAVGNDGSVLGHEDEYFGRQRNIWRWSKGRRHSLKPAIPWGDAEGLAIRDDAVIGTADSPEGSIGFYWSPRGAINLNTCTAKPPGRIEAAFAFNQAGHILVKMYMYREGDTRTYELTPVRRKFGPK